MALESPDFYTISWITALPIERAAAVAMLDEKHEQPNGFVRHKADENVYAWGRIGEHNIVIISLPAGLYGTISAATTASNLLASMPSIRIGLLVGIGGGIARPNENRDIRLGDIVVSQPDGASGGICQYDLFKAKPGNNRERKGFLSKPPTLLLNSLASIQADHELDDSIVPDLLKKMLENKPKMAKQNPSWVYQGSDNDRLFRASYEHVSGTDCSSCSAAEEIQRNPRDTTDPMIHYGIIASGNTLIKDATARDRIVADIGEDCICFEMEAAGLMNHFPCLVIRGICDYADSHKNDRWQRYAAATAAAYAKELLAYIPAADVQNTEKALVLVRSLKEDLAHVRREGERMKSIVETRESKQHLDDIERWLDPPNTSTNINKARDLRHEGTGAWLLTSPVFEDWKAGRRRHLWLHALAGWGKTVLTATILENLEQSGTHPTLAFFFDFSDARKQTLDSHLRSLAFQLYPLGVEAARRLDLLFGSHDDGRKQPSTAALLDCVESMIQIHGKVAVVLDALDECTTRRELISWLRSFATGSTFGNAQLIVTARPEQEFQRQIPRYFGEENCLLLDKQAINADIRSYVTTQLVQLPGFVDKSLSQDLHERIQNKVGDGADGMFRWAKCQLDALVQCRTPRAIEEALESLPQDLNETYQRMVESIPAGLERDSMRLLQFLVHTKRPLTLPQAMEVIATQIDGKQKGFDVNGRPFEAKILDYCPGLVSIVQVTRHWESFQELHLAHFSVKEYLLCQSQYDLTSASISITSTFLRYLTDIPGTHAAEIREHYPMALYAANTWMDFAASAETSTEISEAAADFLRNETTFQRWGRLCQPDYRWHDDRGPLDASGLDYACLNGLIATAKRLLLDNGSDVNAQGSYYGHALQAASHGGHMEIVQLLLAKGADINAHDSYGDSVLQAASRGGYMEIVQLLLANGADINAQGINGTALYAASHGGHMEIVQLLLAKGADVNAQGGFSGNSLFAAAHGGRMEIVQLLLAAGADINGQGGSYPGGALQGSGEAIDKQVTDPGDLLSLDYDVAILFPSANQIRKCKKCRAAFTQTFTLPDIWWSEYCRNSNGYFGCEDSTDKGGALSGTRTWCRFLVKQLIGNADGEIAYEWYKLNVFTTWDRATERTAVLVFDLPPSAARRIQHQLLGGLDEEWVRDPFWMYVRLVEEVVDRQDRAVWAVRDWVRTIEKGRASSERPRPNYAWLHDMARHSIHVSETLELGTNTVDGILTHYRRVAGLLAAGSGTGPKAPRTGAGPLIISRLRFFHDMLRSLHTRSATNKARLQNEIQLVFNMVAQYDARISVEIGRAAQADGAAMRTVAFVTLTFLPATFVCAVFSMSFFDFNAEEGLWSVSGEFWRYWAVAVPVTVVTVAAWFGLERLLRPTPIDGTEGEAGAAGVAVGLKKVLWEKGRGVPA